MTVDPANAESPLFDAALEACDTVIVCEPSASASSDLNVENPSARPPAATNTEFPAAMSVVVPVMTFVERMLPALASALMLNESVPLNVPVPAETVATSESDDVANSACQPAGCESVCAAEVRVDRF